MSRLSDLAASCIRCGFCLEACPTFLETGEESESPRGRIYLARSADEGGLPWSQEAVGRHLDGCVGCRACETACPSGVRYGAILELARGRLNRDRPSGAMPALLKTLTRPLRLRSALALFRLLPGRSLPGFLARSLSTEKPEVIKPRAQRSGSWPAIAESEVPPVKGEVYLLEGCIMRMLYPRVHEATRRLLRRVGWIVRPSHAGCCGALHAHQGFAQESRRLLDGLERALPGDANVIVNSAGCGSHLKEHGSERFRGRVLDVSEALELAGLASALAASPGLRLKATYHDACHLAHGQRVRRQPRALLEAVPGLELVDLPESELCCGSGGVYNLLQPQMARRLLDRKWRHIEATGAAVVVQGNPGCHAWIQQAAEERASPVRVLHTAEVLEASFSGLEALSE